MSEQVKESISALMDDEANELDVRRILNEAAESHAPAQQMRRYQLARTSLQETNSAYLDVDLSGSIAAAIDAEEAPASVPSWLKPVSGFAVAASVAAIVVVGSQGLLGPQGDSGLNASAPQFAQTAPVVSQSLAPNNVHNVAGGAATQADQDLQRLALARQQQRVNAYLQIHARHASMNGNLGAVPLARAANYQVR